MTATMLSSHPDIRFPTWDEPVTLIEEVAVPTSSRATFAPTDCTCILTAFGRCPTQLR